MLKTRKTKGKTNETTENKCTDNNQCKIALAHEKWRAISLAHASFNGSATFYMRFSASEPLGVKILEGTLYIVSLADYFSEALNSDGIAIDGPFMVKDSSITAPDEESVYTLFLSDTEFESSLLGREALVDTLTAFDLNEPLMVKDSSITKPLPDETGAEKMPKLLKVYAALISITPGATTISHRDFELAA